MPRRNNSKTKDTGRLSLQASSLYSCRSKKRFNSKNEAQKIAEIRMLQIPNLELSTYKCPSCGVWHLTSGYRNKN